MRKLLLMILCTSFLVQSRAAQVSGTLTIDANSPASATNFQNFNSLIAYLTSANTRSDAGPSNSAPFGVSGPLVVDVVANSGPYTEQVVFPNITGASATNTITINGNGNTIQFAPTTTSDFAIVRFTNGDYYRLKRLNIRSTSVNYGWGIHFYTGSDYNIIDSCNIDLTTVTSTTSTYSAGIVFSNSLTSPTTAGTNGYFNVISNCNLIGNPTSGGGLYYGIVGGPSSSSSTVSSNKFYNNTIQDFYAYGVYWRYGNGTTFDGNTIKRTSTKTGMTTTYAFSFNNGGLQDTVRNNIITDLFLGSPTTTLQCFGIYAINYHGQSSAPHVVDNNLFNFNTGTGAHYGMYMQSAFNFAVRNNTFAFHNNSSTSQTYAFYTSSGTSTGNAYQIRNNIFFNNRSSTSGQFYTYFITGAFNGNTLGKNSYYGSASSYKMANINGMDYNTFGQYSTMMGTADNTSSDFNPNFINPTTRNFSPQDGWFNGNGIAMPHITKDVTGATRSTPIDIGAYEASPMALDVASNSINVPAAPYAAGVQNITATIRNAGTATITSATINWTVNGIAQTPVNFTGSLAGGATSGAITLGTVNVQAGTVYNISYTVGNPNNTTESNTTNNSTSNVTACSLPGGVYTINQGAAASSTNFTSITGLADYISVGGIGGALTFNVVANSGPYVGQVIFNNVPGVSSTNTITFNGNGNRVEFNNTNASSIGIITVIGTDYITFNQLNVKSLNTSYGVGYLLTAGADYISILGCNIDISTVTGSASAGIAVTASLSSPATSAANNGSFNRFIGNTIFGNSSGGPYYGITAYAHNTIGTNNGYVIENNIIRDFTYGGIYTSGVTGSLIKNNQISRPTKASPTTFYGINMTFPAGDTIVGNKITKPFEMLQTTTNTFYGIYFNSSTSAGRPTVVVNNEITDIKGGGTIYGIYANSVYESRYYHNTISIEYPAATTASATYAFYTTNTVTAQHVQNNLFHINRGGTGNKFLMYVNSANATAYNYRNNALWYDIPSGSTNNYVGYYSGNRVDLAAWHTAHATNPFDSFSVFANPKFRTGYALAPYTPGQDSINNIGADLRSIVPTDILGIAHDSLPDPGAYQFDVSPNDVGLIGFSSPVMPLSLGTHNVNAIIKNFGTATLFSANIDWSVNGVPQFGSTWAGSLNSEDTVSAQLGTYNFSTSGLYTLKAWSSLPNSTTDILRFNDTVQQTFCTPLTGTLTVNPALPAGNGNFQSIGAVTQLLQTCGMAGNVTVNVSAGVYNEKLVYTAIPGLGNGNRLSFVGVDSANTVITSAGISTSDRATILFNGADNISFSNFKIENTGGSNAVAVQILGTAGDRSDSLTFNKCSFTVTSATLSSTINPFEVSSSLTSPTSTTYINATALKIDSSSFLGGYYSMTLYAPIATKSFGHSIKNCYFHNYYLYGPYFYGTERSVFENNRIISGNRQTTTTYALYLNYAGENMVANANEISGQLGGYGIYVNYGQGTASGKVIVSNNMIQIGELSNSTYGLYLGYPTHVVAAHNAVNVTSGSSTATALYIYSNNAPLYNTVDIINNIFNNPNAGYCGWIGDGSASFTFTQVGLNWTIDNNVYYGLGAYTFRSNNYITNTFATWQNLTGLGNDSNSVFMNPNYPSKTDLRVTTTPFNDLGRGNPWVPADIDGNPRNTLTPDVGVSEFAPPANDAAVARIAMPNAPVDTGWTDVKVVIVNSGIAPLTSVDVTYTSGTTTFTQTYTGNIAPNGFDTVTFNATSGLGATSQQLYYAGGNFSVRAFTSSPNSSVDGNMENDTFDLSLCQGMKGVYTINPFGTGNRNFTSFTQAVNAIQCGGALDLVVFDVASGTYNEQLNIGLIPGANANRRVVFRSATLNKNDVILTFSPTTVATNYVVGLNGTNFINFEHLTIRNTSATNGRVVSLGLAGSVNAANVTIRNNNIEGMVVTTSSDANALIFGAAGTNATDVVISNNTLLNGSSGVNLGGQAVVNNYSMRCQIDSNTFTNQYYYGIYLTNRGNQAIRRNVITPSASSYYGIYCSSLSSNSEIAYNKLVQQSNYAIYISGYNQYGEIGMGKIYSNEIILNGGTLSPLFLTNCSDMRIYNNSINSLSTSTSLTNGGITYSGSVASGNIVNAIQMYFVNNAIKAGTAPAISVTNVQGLAAIQQLDHNVYHTTGATLLYLNGTSYDTANFASAKGALAGMNDFNSYYADPTFTSNTNLAPNANNPGSWVLNGRGIQIFDLPRDINNNTRSIAVETGAPDIGAYEFTPSVLPPPAIATGSIGYGNTQHFLAFGDTVATIVWSWSGVLPTTLNFRFAPGTLISNPASSPNNNSAIDTAAHLMDAYWSMDQVGGSGFMYDISLKYKPFQIGNIPFESDIKLANRATQGMHSWWNSNSAFTILDTVTKRFGMNYIFDATSFTGTSDISAPLPVKLTSLRAVKQNTNAVLNWVTASERNASHFIVERSMDRRNFEVAGSVRATGNSSVSNSYQFTDNNIGRVAMGKTVYYRLRMIDVDGKFEYSPMVAVSFEETSKSSVAVYPNPFNTNVSINVTAVADANANITVVDLYGKVVAEITREVVKGDNLIQVDTLQHLAPGVYFVKVNAGNSEMVTKLIKE